MKKVLEEIFCEPYARLLAPLFKRGVTDVLFCVGNVPQVRLDGRWQALDHLYKGDVFVPSVSREAVEQTLFCASGGSLYAHERELARGYLSLKGGHRLGVAGTCVYGQDGVKTVREVSALCLRVAHEVKGCGEGLSELVGSPHVPTTLLFAPPGCGKTTLLRDLARLASVYGHHVCVLDSRGEICAVSDGVASFDMGPLCTVLTNFDRRDGITSAVRALRPDVCVFDEFYDETEALLDGARCGVSFLFSAHASTLDEVRARPGLKRLFDEGVVRVAVRLDASYTASVVFDRKDEA